MTITVDSVPPSLSLFPLPFSQNMVTLFTDAKGVLFFYQETKAFFHNTMMHRPIARQQRGKYIPAEAKAHNNRLTIARQRISKHTSLTIEAVLYFLRGPFKVAIKKCSAG
jgi:hypothetical protein